MCPDEKSRRTNASRMRRYLPENENHAVDYLNTKRGLIAGAATVLFYFDEMGEIRYKSYPINICLQLSIDIKIKSVIKKLSMWKCFRG